MDKKNYFVKLTLVVGGYEKTLKHLVVAADENQAYREAILAESHGDLEWLDDYRAATDLCDEFYYKAKSCQIIDDDEYSILSRFLYVHG